MPFFFSSLFYRLSQLSNSSKEISFSLAREMRRRSLNFSATVRARGEYIEPRLSDDTGVKMAEAKKKKKKKEKIKKKKKFRFPGDGWFFRG